MSELKNCPHCPKSMIDVLLVEATNRWQVFCGCCGSSSGSHKTKEQAVIGWNTRTPDPKIESLTAQLEEANELISLLRGVISSHQKTCESFGASPDRDIPKVNIEEFLTKKD